jgi:hypothetical protein
MILGIKKFLKKLSFTDKALVFFRGLPVISPLLAKLGIHILWKERIKNVLASPANKDIKRVQDAGKVKNGIQMMHNGIRVYSSGYYGKGMGNLIKKNKGVHEPEEEKIFGEVLKEIKPGSVMLELGSYWAFYSMWFYKEVKDAVCFMVEPEKNNIEIGMRNFELNNVKGKFINKYVGSNTTDSDDGTGIICVDDIISENNINYLDILHCDIQGYEAEMLNGSVKSLGDKKINYIFISTHTNELHYKCMDILKSFEYRVIESLDMDKISSMDGLIVAKAPYKPGN